MHTTDINYLNLIYNSNLTYKQKLAVVNSNFLQNEPRQQQEHQSLLQQDSYCNTKDINTSKDIDSAIKWLEQPNNYLVGLKDPSYPKLLKQIHSPPIALFVRGNLDALEKDYLAIVGSRKASPYGIHNALYFSHSLSKLGIGIISGLALGIDATAHKGALEANGATIAVLGSGINNIYPNNNRSLAEQIVENNGAIISELPLDTKPNKYNFPQRNRIISGISIGTLVIEAALKSGSLITARLTLEHNREVFTIPNVIGATNYQGNHELIRQGAKLVEKLEHITEELTNLNLPNLAKHVRNPHAVNKLKNDTKLANTNVERAKVLKIIANGPILAEQLCNITALKINEISAILMELELEGYIINDNGYYFLTKLTT